MVDTQALLARWRTRLNSISGVRQPIPELQSVFDQDGRAIWHMVDGPRKVSTGVPLDPPQAVRWELWKYRINKARRIRRYLSARLQGR